MNKIRQFFRLIHINFVLVRHGLDRIVVTIPMFAPFHWLVKLNPRHWFVKTEEAPGLALRLALEELGPIFVKFGQMLSTRPDLLPPELIFELSKLQDKVPSFPGEIAKSIVENALGAPIHEVYSRFDVAPLASASIAQVHAACLPNGKEVVVKVLRPQIIDLIKQDIGLMYTFTKLAEKYSAQARRLRFVAVVAEFEKTIFDELDLMREAANASQLRRNFLNSDLLYVPEVYWHYTRSNVMTMERIYGLPVTDIAAFREHGINIKELAERGVKIFFTQVFRDRFFHADMHPGNIFVSPYHKENPQFICVDMGIVGSLDTSDQRYIAENFLAFLNRDYRRVAELHIESGWLSPDTRIDEFEAAIRTVSEPIFERPLSEISGGQLLWGLFKTAQRFNMHIQPQLVLLQKTLISIEGLARQIYPGLDLWATAKPFLESWVRDQFGPKALYRKVVQESPYWLEKMPEVPRLLYSVLHNVQQQQLHTRDPISPVRDEKIIQMNLRFTLTSMLGGVLFFAGIALAYWQGVSALHIASISAGISVLFTNWFIKTTL